MRQRVLADIFLRYGGGAHYVQRLTAAKHWNWLAWALILVTTIGWVVFLLWNP